MREPLAVVGMAGIFPGAPDLDALWERVLGARPAPTTSLETRWGVPRARYLGPPGAPDRAYVDDAFCVDFEAPPGEDRQVALGREALARALEDARQGGAAIDPARTAVVLATSWSAPSFFAHDAAKVVFGRVAEGPPPYAPDQQLDAIARGLGGPRLAVDTACASSLYALDVAAALLDAGAADAAVVLGLNALLTPFLYLGFSKLGALSPSSAILPFARDASGMVPGEGAGAVVLVPRSRARGAVHGVVRAIGLSADGAERSLFAPGARGQTLAYERAWAGLDLGTVDYVEAHGTATAVGDATELATLDAFFGPHRRGGEKLPIGSMKALVGHTLAAAGIASLLKALLVLRARVLPPHVAVEPHPELARARLTLERRPRAWQALGRPMRVGVSSFGFGGSNAHVVVEGASEASAPAPARQPRPEPLAIVGVETMLPLPDAAAIDAAGLRAGPKVLGRLDPLQLAVTHLVRGALAQAGDAPGDAGVVVATNLGGAMSLRLSRKYAAGFEGIEASEAPELTVEAIASSLPSMTSGLPAHHLDLRAFHATLSGSTATFWTSLLLAPHWLASRCARLVLVGARANATPLDVRAEEGAAALCIEPLAQARARGAKVLATLRIVDVEAEPLPRATDARVTSDLREGALGEATGVDALARAATGGARCTAIDVVDGGRRVRTVVVEREAEVERASIPAKLPLEVRFRKEAPRNAVADVEPSPREAWLDHAEAALHAFFAAQRAAATLLGAPTVADVAPARRRRPENVVLTAASAGAADLVVDEAHPYFFDHPLDHVPGILLAEGILQLAERDGAYVRTFGARFRRFCDKRERVRLELDGARGRALQRGEVVATFDVEHAPAPRAAPASPAPPRPVRLADAALLHKRRGENVLVTPLEHTEEGWVASVRPPPAGHFFHDGDAAFYSPLYALEAARQAVMLGAHSVVGLPLGLPMNLLSIRVLLDAPLARDARLRVRLEADPVRDLGGALVAEVRAILLAGAARTGVVHVRAQVVDLETYERQRWATS